MAGNPNCAAQLKLGRGGYRASWAKSSSTGMATWFPIGNWRLIASVRVPGMSRFNRSLAGMRPGSTSVDILHLTRRGRGEGGRDGPRLGASPPASLNSCAGLRLKKERRRVLEDFEFTACEDFIWEELNLRHRNGRVQGVQTWR
jgi:hypothetical protein